MRTLLAAVLALALGAPAAAAAPEGDRPARGEPLPATLEGWLRRQDAQFADGKKEEALAEARARVEKEKGAVEARYLLGRVLGNTGDLDGAKAQFLGCLELDGLYAPAWRGLAKVHMLKKDYEGALREARKAYELEPGPLEGILLLAESQFQSGDRAAAHRLLEEVLAKAPENTQVRAFRAALLFKDGRMVEGEKELRVALSSAPKDMSLRKMIVSILAGTGRMSEAVEECRAALRIAPADTEVHRVLIDLHARSEDWEAAIAAVQELLKLDLPDDLRRDANDYLAALRARRDRPRAPDAERTMEAILRDLASPDPAVRREAIRAMDGRPLEKIPRALLEAVKDPDETVRILAVRILGREGGPAAAAFFEILLFHPKERDASPAVRSAAARALARLGTPGALPILVRALEDPEPAVLRSAIEGIAALTGKCFVLDPEAPVPEKDRPRVREQYREWWDGPAGIPWKRRACAALGTTGIRQLAAYLVPWLESEDASLREAARDGMREASGDPSWSEVLLGTPEARRAAVDRAWKWVRP